LECGHASERLHHHQLHGAAEWKCNRNRNQHVLYTGQSFAFHQLQLHG
jgi:hypothetical protein